MLEIYVALTLLGLGYLINLKQPATTPKSKSSKPKGEKPSMNTVYDSTYYDQTRATEFDAVQKANTQGKRTSKLSQVSELTGEPIDQFVHNNMQPFFRGSMKQNVGSDANSSLLENFGVKGELIRKKEISNMFELERNVMQFDPNSLEGKRDRMAVGKVQNNVLPFEQTRVGPGIGQGYESKPVGGFQQFESQQYTIPKSVDELRVESKPKAPSFTAAPIPGLKGSMRGKQGTIQKNRVDRWFKQGMERLFKTTGAWTGEAKIPTPEVKSTTRTETTQAYQGTGYQPTQGVEQRPTVRGPIGNRSELEGFEQGAAVITDKGRGDDYDYGKTGIQVYGNERDITQVKTQVSNVVTAVKSIVAPLQDVLRGARKEYATLPAREFGAMSIQIPSKIAVMDPNAILRTTLKETQLHDSEVLNVWSSTKRGPTYDPDEVARTTTRNTIDPMDTHLNLAAAIPSKITVHDPADVARVTTKETTLEDGRIGGVDAQNKKNAAYEGEEFLMKLPQGASYEDVEYIGDANAAVGGGDAYKVQEFDIRATMKQDPKEYIGSATHDVVKPMSYADIYEATTRDLKNLVVNHEPTVTSAKVVVGGDDIHVNVSKQELPALDLPTASKAVPSADPTATVEHVTRIRQPLRNDDRLDADLLEPFKKNPFTHSLSSA